MAQSIILERFFHNETKTLGDLTLYEGNRILLRVKTLELPWKDNQRRVSCIPALNYVAKQHTSPKFGWCLWLQGVPERSEILVHSGNYTSQILGCILPGIIHDDLNNDGIMDVKHSGIAVEALKHYIKQEEINILIRYT